MRANSTDVQRQHMSSMQSDDTIKHAYAEMATALNLLLTDHSVFEQRLDLIAVAAGALLVVTG